MKITRPGSPEPRRRPLGPWSTWWLWNAGLFIVGVLLLIGILHVFGHEFGRTAIMIFVLSCMVLALALIFKREPEPVVSEETPDEETPAMDVHGLDALAGRWRGTNRLHDPHSNAPEETPSMLTLRPMPGGQIVRIEQEWSYQGAAQEGLLLIIAGAAAGHATLHWVDTWHQATTLMEMRQDEKVADRFTFLGRYPAPTGPDWGWRVELKHDPAGTLRLDMFNISPDRKSTPAIEATYTRERTKGA